MYSKYLEEIISKEDANDRSTRDKFLEQKDVNFFYKVKFPKTGDLHLKRTWKLKPPNDTYYALIGVRPQSHKVLRIATRDDDFNYSDFEYRDKTSITVKFPKKKNRKK